MLERLGPYRIEAELGLGGMGRVYAGVVDGEVRGLAPGTRVAIKLVHPHLLDSPGFFKRFLREAEIGRTVRHENVVRTLDCDAVMEAGEQRNFLVMEYVEGQTLRQLSEELGSLPEQLCRHIGAEVAKGLHAVHRAGVVHRDLKPENVLITPDHVVKLMDLGVARFIGDGTRLSSTGSFVGSLQYASPEQFKGGGGDVDGRVDLYSLGVVLYELACGVNPFVADDTSAVIRNVLEKVPRRLGTIRPQASPFFEEAVHTLLAKDREQRFRSASELAEVLTEGEDSEWWRQRARALRVATASPLRRVRIPRETSLYGRQDEVAELSALFGCARGGEGQVLLIDGEAGIGKTRLVDEVIGRLVHEGEDLNFLFGSYPPGGAATDAGAFCTAYREHFGAEGLEEAVAPYLSASRGLAPSFAALLRGEPPPRGEEPLTKQSLQAVFLQVTRSLAAERPTVVLIDDLHFTSDDGRGLFAALADAVAGHRVLLIGTTRPGGIAHRWVADLERLPHFTRLSLDRLGAKDLTNLLMDAFHSRRLAETLGFDVAAKSDGNPFFVFEIIHGLRHGKRIEQRPDGSWASTGVLGEIAIPDSVQDLVRARIAGLDEDDKDLLDVAACYGFDFDPLVVAEAAGLGRTPALKRLARIEARDVLVRSVGRRFVFDHHQVQEVLYTQLPELLRQDYHSAIAAAIAGRAGQDSEPESLDGATAWAICHHYLAADDGRAGVRYLEPALAHLRDGCRTADEIALVDRALGLGDLLSGEARLDLLLRKARTLDLLGQRAAQRETLDAAIELADSLGDPSRAARARRLLGWYLMNVRELAEAETTLKEALRLANQGRDKAVVAQVTGNLGSLFHYLGREREALEHHVKQMQIAESIDSRADLVTAHGNIASSCVRLGRFDEADRHYDRCLALARELGLRRDESVATMNSSYLLLSLGRLADAERRAREGLELCRRIGFVLGQSVGRDILAACLCACGRLDEARKLSEQAVELAREIGNRGTEVEALCGLAVALRGLGRADAASDVLQSALEVAEAVSDEGDRAQIEADLARLDHEAGRDAQAVERLRRAITGAAGLDRPEVVVPALARLAVLAPAESGRAVDAFRAAAAHLQCGVALESRFLLWQATGDGEHLAAATELLARLVDGAAPEHRDGMLARVSLYRAVRDASATS